MQTSTEKYREIIESVEYDGLPLPINLMDEIVFELEIKVEPNILGSLAVNGLKMFLNINHEIKRELVIMPKNLVLGILDLIDDSSESNIINLGRLVTNQEFAFSA